MKFSSFKALAAIMNSKKSDVRPKRREKGSQKSSKFQVNIKFKFEIRTVSNERMFKH